MGWFGEGQGQAGSGPVDLIGREPEIQRIKALLGQLTGGAGEALLLSGDPGVGKTTLLDLAAVLAADSGIRLLRATGSQFEARDALADIPPE